MSTNIIGVSPQEQEKKAGGLSATVPIWAIALATTVNK